MSARIVKSTDWRASLLLSLLAFILGAAGPQALAQDAPAALMPSGLAPGLYYYFHGGDIRPAIHYVPYPTGVAGDPFSRPVRPLPVRGQEGFPDLPFDTLQKCTIYDFEKFRQGPAPPAQHPAGAALEDLLNELDGSPRGLRDDWFSQNQVWRNQAANRQGPAAVAPAEGRPPNTYAFAPPARGSFRPPPPPDLPPAVDLESGQLAPQSPFQSPPPGAGGLKARGTVRGVSLHDMHQALSLAKQADRMISEQRYSEAAALLEKATAADPNPNSGPIHSNLGTVFKKLGQVDRAVSEYQAALRFEPQLESPLLGLASCYQLKGAVPEAVLWVKKYLADHPRGHHVADARIMLASLERAARDLPVDDPSAADYLASVTAHGEFRWSASRLPLKVFVADGGPRNNRAFRQFIAEAFNAWCQATGGRLAWTPVGDGTPADITCRLVERASQLSQSTGSEGGLTLTETLSGRDGTEEIQSAEISIVLLDASGRPVSERDIRATCLHEAGHALGMKGHSSNNRDVMFFTESPTTSPYLTDRDRNTIGRLYSAYPVFNGQKQ